MSGAGVPDFFYREAQRLGYVARSAFKVIITFMPSSASSPSSYIDSSLYLSLSLSATTASTDSKTVQAHQTRLLCS